MFLQYQVGPDLRGKGHLPTANEAAYASLKFCGTSCGHDTLAGTGDHHARRLYSRPEYRVRDLSFLTAMPRAFFCPTTTTSRRPRVIPV